MKNLLTFALVLGLASCSSQDSIDWLCQDGAKQNASNEFKVWCPTQTEDYFIPVKYACEPKGAGLSPPVRWKGVPKEATHLRLLLIDTMCDYMCKDHCTRVHWQLDLPLKQIQESDVLSTHAVAEGASQDPSIVALTLPNADGERKYLPICLSEYQTHAIVLKAVAYKLEGTKKIVIARVQSSPLLCSFERNSFIERSPSAFLLDLTRLKKEERWQEIVQEGEKAASHFRDVGEYENEFFVLDELVSHYSRLGKYAIASEKCRRLGEIALILKHNTAIIDSLFKLSVSLRGIADESKNKAQQKLLFAEATRYGELALERCRRDCPSEYQLLGKTLYNIGAANADDPEGDVAKAITYYKEALEIFNANVEMDYARRTEIRLGKAYLLLGKLYQTKEIIEKLEKEPLEKRTYMHWLYLKAQLATREGKNKEAIELSEKGRGLALNLNAKAEKRRFEELLDKLLFKKTS
jgi:phosphatidylethanolamine-binding protein (PEBP) family uncharacterized protein